MCMFTLFGKKKNEPAIKPDVVVVPSNPYGSESKQLSTSQVGINLIKEFEGFRSNAYPDPATGGAPWTIGYGTTKGVKKGMTVTQAQAEQLLRDDVKVFEEAVRKAVKVPLTQNQFDALVSFTYNVGPGNMTTSTLIKLINLKEYKSAAEQFLRWNKAAGKVMAGLTRRREAERKLFLK